MEIQVQNKKEEKKTNHTDSHTIILLEKVNDKPSIPAFFRECKLCKMKFLTKNNNKLFCSKKCALKFHTNLYYERLKMNEGKRKKMQVMKKTKKILKYIDEIILMLKQNKNLQEKGLNFDLSEEQKKQAIDKTLQKSGRGITLRGFVAFYIARLFKNNLNYRLILKSFEKGINSNVSLKCLGRWSKQENKKERKNELNNLRENIFQHNNTAFRKIEAFIEQGVNSLSIGLTKKMILLNYCGEQLKKYEEKNGNISGWSPVSIAVSLLYVAGKKNKIKITKVELEKIFGISQISIRNCERKFILNLIQ